MSWNITGIGSKVALLKQIDCYFDPMIAQNKGAAGDEYGQAKKALRALVFSAPDGHLLQIESWGSAGYGTEHPSFNVKIDMKLLTPTFKE